MLHVFHGAAVNGIENRPPRLGSEALLEIAARGAARLYDCHDVERVQARGADEVDGARDELVARGASLRRRALYYAHGRAQDHLVTTRAAFQHPEYQVHRSAPEAVVLDLDGRKRNGA